MKINTLPTLMLVPTGIGCSIGGFAGDALPSARLLAAASGSLITHPNVMNGASLYWLDERIHYVEGYALDRFASGFWALRPTRRQCIGLLLDSGIENELMHRQIQVADGCRATLGLDIGPIITTDLPLEVEANLGNSGASLGLIGRPDTLLRAGEKLRSQGATAIAVVARFPDDFQNEALSNYRKGTGVDFLAGAEAVISHLLVRYLKMPCAHAPALHSLPLEENLDPRVAGEELGFTFLPCVLVGLSRAPGLIDKTLMSSNDLDADQLGAIVIPEGALGGEAVLACIERQVPLIAVENPSTQGVTVESLGLNNEVMKVKNYSEAAGLVLALREGISPKSLIRPITSLKKLL